MSDGESFLDGDRLIRLAVRIVMFLKREATREGKARPSSSNVLCEFEALNYAMEFYQDTYVGSDNNRGVRVDEKEVRRFFEKLMKDTNFP